MSAELAPGAATWADALRAAALFAVDPVGTGGVVLRALPGPARDRWLESLRVLLSRSTPMRRVPLHVSDGRLIGGLDLAATLQAGRPVAERGLLAEVDGGVLLLAMAERLPGSLAARLAHVLDSGEVVLERDGLTARSPTRFGVVALDEGIAPEERPPAALVDRLAFALDLAAVPARDAHTAVPEPGAIAAARARLPAVGEAPEIVSALCQTAAALGIDSLRAPLLALRVARAAAALEARSSVSEEDAALAARLVFSARATQLPMEETAAEPEELPEEETRSATPPESEPPLSDESEPPLSDESELDDAHPPLEDGSLADRVVAAAESAIPEGLLAQLRLAGGSRRRPSGPGKAGARQTSSLRGRPIGVRSGRPRAGARLNVIETLRSAAPWQRLRARDRAADASATSSGASTSSPSSASSHSRRPVRVEVRPDDFRVTRYRQRSETTAIFVVDASGSTALHRLAEAKGAVELLLGECYVRRDRVALIAFRGREAELLLPPTRSLVRAKRGLASLPGGGATPLASGIDGAAELARAVERRGGTPLVVLLTDGQANVARDGSPGRAAAEEDAVASARLLRAEGVGALLVDTSPRPQPRARRLAEEMGARYLPLPHASSAALCQAVQAAMPDRRSSEAS